MFDKNEDFVVVKLGQVSCVILTLSFEHELIQCAQLLPMSFGPDQLPPPEALSSS